MPRNKALERKFLLSLESRAFREYVRYHENIDRSGLSRPGKIARWVGMVDGDYKDGLLTEEERDEFITWDFKD